MILGIDCDQVLVDAAEHWRNWLESRYCANISVRGTILDKDKYPYNLSEAYEIDEGDDPMAFWKNSRLYSGMKPIEGAVEYTKKLKEDGHTLVCITRISGDSAKSKADWLKKWFPHFDGFIFTGNNIKEKTWVSVDVMVDDSLKQLNQFTSRVKCIWFDSDYYQQDIEPNSNVTLVSGWESVYNKICEIEQERQLRQLRFLHGVY